ncbi:MAG: type IX secretion system membrane protein PorP/SprF [Bacteroidetes bacterium]|nr:type IX secretion system membrane protein PorP/SprF [Bacteroidota bacterium]MCB0802540.1 type IX secretion system membrane protein PorP/SprF [Flavobacteriales bacterium]NOG56619.1 type IX secretion system membrane protein PorP/SprF [Bacteroidota bacterium]
MKKIILYIACSILLVSGIMAQQLPQYSQYILNRYVINPASAGSENYFVGQSNYRSQWEGIKDAPRTYILSVNGPIANQKMGIGGYMFVDVTGPTRRNGFNLSYSYHVKLSSEIKLSFAINAGILSYTVDGTEIFFKDQTDNVISRAQESNLYPDAGFSFYLYGPKFFFGGSAPQLIQNQLDFKSSIKDPTGRLVNHYFAMGGYTIDLGNNLNIEPSFLVKYVKPTPVQYEASLRGIYQKSVWLGLSYRQDDAIVLLGGYTFQDSFSLGYSYDILQSGIKNYSTGTHEIMLSIKFNKRDREKVEEEE